MGIPYFYRFIRNKDYKGVLRRGVPKYVSSFMLDFNGIIHKVAQIVYAYGEGNDPQRRKLVEQADPQILEAEFYQALATKLSEIIFQVNPQDILVIAVDGVAPQAKMSQQRQRRFKSAIERSQNSVFDSNSITPCTDFMIRLDNFIQRWLVSASKILPPKTIYSSHMVPGEGEHKCFSKGTKIRMWDGSVKNIENILVGDIVITDNGKPTKVLNLVRGTSQLYTVTQNNGMSYTVNENHILSLKISDHKRIYWSNREKAYKVGFLNRETLKYQRKSFSIYRYVNKELALKAAEEYKNKILGDDVLDINVKDYLKLPTNTKNKLYGYKCGNINWEKRHVELDPRILGIWLGDGSKGGADIATVDKEIVEYCEKWAEQNNAYFEHYTRCVYKFKIKGESTAYGNPLSVGLKKYKMIDKKCEKRIPIEYIVNDRDTRLKLLAGLIDTDGNLTHNGRMIRFNQGPSNYKLFDDVVFLCQSLGFKTCVRETKTSYKYKNEKRTSTAKFLTISGNIEEIPTLIKRKKCNLHNNGENSISIDRLRTKIQIEKVNTGEYYGFNIEGNHRFLLEDCTVTHNCMDLIREGQIKGDGAHVIYGMDADLIMLSMLAPLDHIFLMREDIRDVIDIDNLKYALSQEIGTRTAIPDYVLMTFMIGNDFLPHMPAFDDMEEAIDTMIRVYKMLGRPLTISKTKEIDWDSFVLFLAEMAKEEHRLLELESHKDYKYPSRMMNASISRTQKKSDGGAMELTSTKIEIFTKFDPNIFRGAWYQNAFEPKGDKAVFEKLLPGYNLGATPEKIINMVKTYLVGINWVYRYYNMGMDGINTDWVYKYHYAPLLTDISAVASQISSVDGYKPRSDNLTVNPVHQLLSVLPLKSKDLLPQEVKHLMTRDSPIADIYPESAIIELDGKNYEWQGIAIIPFVEMKRIINVVNQTTIFTQERLEQFSSKDNIELVKDPSQMEIDEKTMKFRQFLERKKREEFIRGNRRYRSKGRGRGRGRSRDDRRNPYKR